MTTLLLDRAPCSPEGKKTSEQEIRDLVQRALVSPIAPRSLPERRGVKRRPYPYVVHLSPVDQNNVVEKSKTIAVIGKHLSECGLDFYHYEAIPYRRMIASLPGGEHGWSGFLMELSWCRFTQHGWYENGGRFLQVAPSPLETADPKTFSAPVR
ncbi:hypothetical protein [Lignipirellula cremea]|uniref:Uncharacterized protein n=1 Tax=Lignipirellula cremea TaxID=2528010 RepID=A0A518DYY2_9BACT|nr:hypothetical protein [Lignipirellula cremea]QDU97034.1 hypothetical protein Pla8534_48590 [Lignipirellula cremea]